MSTHTHSGGSHHGPSQPQHTIHRAHIHHGWDNSFTPRLRIAPGESIQFETLDASSGQLNGKSTAADLAKLDLGRVNPVTGPVYIEAVRSHSLVGGIAGWPFEVEGLPLGD